jgi:hypothetical protein
MMTEAVGGECPRCGAPLLDGSPPSEEAVEIISTGDTLELVILGDHTIEETRIVMVLNAAAEAMVDSGDIPTVQQKASYEMAMEKLIEWIVRNRLPQIARAMRQP